MIKTFCDFCTVEIPEALTEKTIYLSKDGVILHLSISTGVRVEGAGLGHICGGCVASIVQKELAPVENLTPVQLPADSTRQRLIEEIAQGMDAHKIGAASDAGLINNLYRLFDSPEYSPVTGATPLGFGLDKPVTEGATTQQASALVLDGLYSDDIPDELGRPRTLTGAFDDDIPF